MSLARRQPWAWRTDVGSGLQELAGCLLGRPLEQGIPGAGVGAGGP